MCRIYLTRNQHSTASLVPVRQPYQINFSIFHITHLEFRPLFTLDGRLPRPRRFDRFGIMVASDSTLYPVSFQWLCYGWCWLVDLDHDVSPATCYMSQRLMSYHCMGFPTWIHSSLGAQTFSSSYWFQNSSETFALLHFFPHFAFKIKEHAEKQHTETESSNWQDMYQISLGDMYHISLGLFSTIPSLHHPVFIR